MTVPINDTRDNNFDMQAIYDNELHRLEEMHILAKALGWDGDAKKVGAMYHALAIDAALYYVRRSNPDCKWLK